MTDARSRRLAENESRFREINERMRDGLRGVVPDDELLPFICECGDRDCRDTISLSLAEYEEVRRDPRHFVVVPGHEVPDVEDVIAGRDDRYAVVRKKPPTWHIAEATDPRS